MSCELGHGWETFSGDYMVCMFCDAEGQVVVTYEPNTEDRDGDTEDVLSTPPDVDLQDGGTPGSGVFPLPSTP